MGDDRMSDIMDDDIFFSPFLLSGVEATTTTTIMAVEASRSILEIHD